MQRARQPELWRRVTAGLRYWRTHGSTATLRRLFPRSRTYKEWIEAYDKLSAVDIQHIKEDVQKLSIKPLISIVLSMDASDEIALEATVLSVENQLYPNWELCISAMPETLRTFAVTLERLKCGNRRIKFTSSFGDDTTATANAGLSAATGEFVLFLSPRDRLAAHALYMVAVEICRSEDVDIIYSDEDVIDEQDHRKDPRFKSDWNPDFFLGNNFIGRLAAYRRSLIDLAGGFRSEFRGAEEYDLNLRLIEHTVPERIRHVPMILYHRRSHKAPTISSVGAIQCAVDAHLQRSKVGATAVPASPGAVRISYPMPAPAPGVSLIVPTRDCVELLKRCVDGLLQQTDYNHLEVMIVDNDSKLPETHDYFKRLTSFEAVRILSFHGPFNYSAINNFAAARARHSVIGFMNNDVEIIHADWLQEMVSHALRSEIGAVGAKLYYPDDTIQHAGTIVGLGGLAGHAFRHFDRNDPGYLNRLQLTQNCSAVTAACMLMRKHVFDQAGGFDELNLPVAYNDVDLCLRVIALGYRIVWTPFAELYHHESGSRPSDFSPERIQHYKDEMKYLQTRWKDVIRHDPFYSPNLTIESEDFSLAFPPRVVRPWRC